MNVKKIILEIGTNLSRHIPLLIIGICVIIFFKNKGFFSEQKSEIITSDGHGYYGYLPATFIYHNHSFDFAGKAIQNYYVYTSFPGICVEQNGQRINKYYIGTAILMFPFFTMAHVLTKFSNYPVDGYSLYYQYFVGIAALFYLFVGLFFLRKIFELFKINTLLSTILLTAVIFGTNLYHYALFAQGMSHVYSFALISTFIYFLCITINNYSLKNGLITVVILGLIALCRPTNLIIVFIAPFFFNDFTDFIKWVKINLLRWHLFIYLPVFFTICAIQSFYWYKTTEMFYLDSYKYEGFNFSNPYIFDFLFSFKKGFFIYTPFFCTLFFALILLFKRSAYKTLIFILFFMSLTYILSSWWNWYYGGSFGMRALIDFYPLWCFIIAFSLNGIAIKNYFILASFTILTSIVNIIQDYQIRKFIMHWDCMDREKYFKIFLKTDDKYKGVLFYDNSTGTYDKYHNGHMLYKDICLFDKSKKNINFVRSTQYQHPNNSKNDTCGYVNAVDQYSTGFEINSKVLLKDNPHIIVKTYADVFIADGTSAEIVLCLEQNGKIKNWESKVIPNFIDSKINKWYRSKYHTVLFGVQTGDILKCYLHYRSGEIALIDNLQLEIYEFKTTK